MDEQLQLYKAEMIGNVLDDAAVHLDADQITVLPYLAHGMSATRISKITGVSTAHISKWKKEDVVFNAALTRLSAVIGKWHGQQIQLLALRAWEVMWDILGQDYSAVDEKEKLEMGRTARFIAKSVAPEHSTKHITHEIVNPELNVSEGTLDALARRMKELDTDPTEVVDGKYRIEDVEAAYICHPDTDFGIMNYDNDKKAYQCHICGGWFTDFPEHLVESHGLTTTHYRDMFKIADEASKW